MLSLSEVACIRGGRPLFSGLNLNIPPGQVLRVQGDNGAGKTSLLRLVCGLLAPSQGEVRWRGQPLSKQPGWSCELVYLGHAAALKDDLSPLENLRSACLLAGQPSTEAHALAALGQAGLRGHEHTPVRRLSQGQRRRSALARLLLSAAPLWVLDEPFNTLDRHAAAWLESVLLDHLNGGGLLVLTSHQDGLLARAPSQQVLAL